VSSLFYLFFFENGITAQTITADTNPTGRRTGGDGIFEPAVIGSSVLVEMDVGFSAGVRCCCPVRVCDLMKMVAIAFPKCRTVVKKCWPLEFPAYSAEQQMMSKACA
jgi:hypothetical protein